MKFKVLAASLILICSPMSLADPIDVVYEIGSYSEGGFSASWLHSSTGCGNTGPLGGTLYMCGGTTYAIEGTISGLLDEGYLWVDGGNLNIGGYDFGVLGGLLGDFDVFPYVYGIELETLGTFLFEPLDMGAGLPNFFDGDELILWGQNLQAYFCRPGRCSNRWGIDLYGQRITVPEPRTLALIGFGLLGLGFIQRRARSRKE